MARELCIILQANYGYGDGWEDLTTYKCGLRRANYGSATRESKKDIQDYRQNEPQYSYRIVRRYEEMAGEVC